MWFWIVSSITGSILGSATSAWFEKTAMGRWFNRKMENIYNWAADRYGFEVLKSEDKWRKKYPNIAKKIDELESRLHYFEGVVATLLVALKEGGVIVAEDESAEDKTYEF